MNPLKLASTWLFLFILLLCWVVIRVDVTPAAVDQSPADTAYHVSNAFNHLQAIAREPHSLGTAANDRVRTYIDSTCRALGLDVRQLPFTVTLPESKGLIIARGINIAATLHAATTLHAAAPSSRDSTSPLPAAPSSNDKKILVMAHYDSEPNALGAGDDGSACAAMLECIRALRASTPLQHDIIFLFTNGEEDGLLGAWAFSRDTAEVHQLGFVINFDGRGDAGKCLMFRTSPDNDWVLQEYARAPIHHSGASLYSELFKLLPNNTDFTPLQNTGVPGLDFAFAEGFVHYHNLTDNVANIDKRMMQEQGDNMLGSIRHFAGLDLRTPPANSLPSNTTYFNLIGNILIHYSLSVNFILLLLTNALVLFALIWGIYRKQIRIAHAAFGLVLFPLVLVLLYFLAGWTWGAVRSAWPLYLGYYPNAYNAYYFYLALAAEALLVFSLVYQWPLRKWSLPSLFIAILVCQTVLLDIFYRFIPAGVYFLYFPLIGSAIFAATLMRRTPPRSVPPQSAPPQSAPPQSPPPRSTPPRSVSTPLSSPRNMPRVLGSLPAILWLAPLVYSLAELFDAQPEAAMVAPITGLLLGFLLPVLAPSLRQNRWFIPGTAAVVMLLAVVLGITNASYNHDRPFKTDIRYLARPDTHEAWWVSHDTRPDRWNSAIFKEPLLQPSSYTYPLASSPNATELFAAAPPLDLPAPAITLTKDSAIGDHRLLFLHCQPAAGTATIHVTFTTDHPADSLSLADAHLSGPLGWLEYDAPPDEGFDLTLTCPRGAPFTITITGRTMGLPAATGFPGYPPDVIPTPASYANTTMVQRTYKF